MHVVGFQRLLLIASGAVLEGMEDGIVKMKKTEKPQRRELFIYLRYYYCWASTCLWIERGYTDFTIMAGVLRICGIRANLYLFKEGTHGPAI